MKRHHINYLKAIRNAFIGFVMAFSAYWIVQLIYWEFYPYKTAFISEPMQVLNENLEVTDGILRLEVNFTKETDVSPIVSRNIVCLDGTVYLVFTPQGAGVTRPQGTFRAISTYELSPDISKDVQCYFQFTNAYEVNPIRTITKVWKSELFIVRQ